MTRLFMNLRRDRLALDGAKDRHDPERNVRIRAGRHEVERVKNPYGYHGNWLVLKGTLIGATEEFWRQWEMRKHDSLIVRSADDLVIDFTEVK